jgi:hypothetical protein
MNRWTKVANKTPDTDRQVIAFSGDTESHHIGLAFFSDGKWWAGYRMELGDVNRWMDLPGEPKDFAYWKHRITAWWRKRVQNAEDASDWMRGWGSRNAQLDRKIIYFTNEKTGEIRMGLPEQFPASPGFSKVVCNNTREAEAWSDRLRQYNLGKEQRKDEEREAVEGEMLKHHRSEVHALMANSRSKLGREFLRRHLERTEQAQSRRRMTREEFLHSEAYEKNH